MDMINANNQQSCSRGYREEQWIDFILNKLPTLTRQRLEQHLPSCNACRELVEEWGELLADRKVLAERKGLTDAAIVAESRGDVQQVTGGSSYELSEKKYQSLQRYVKKQALLGQLGKKAKEYRNVIAGAAAAIMLLLLPFNELRSTFSTPDHVDQYVQHYEPAAMSFVNGMDSSRYRVETAEGQASSGYIWLKQDWSEAFLWLENLQHIGLNDYQAWAVSGERASSLGIIQLVGTEGHLYINAPTSLRPTDFITLTVEPKGGSSAPTSRPIMLIVKQ